MAIGKWRKSLMIGAVTLTGGWMGCGYDDGLPKLYPVHGKILLDGQPVADVEVTFEPVEIADKKYGRPGNARSDAEGKIVPWVLRPGDGLPAGKFRVGVTSRVQVGGPQITENMPLTEYAKIKWEWKVPERYMHPSTSGLEVEVTRAGMKPDIIELTSE